MPDTTSFYSDDGGSTKWEWRLCKIGSPPGGDRLPKAVRTASSGRKRDQWKPITLTLRYRGGPEDGWLVVLGADSWRFPGWMCLSDVVRTMGQARWARP